MRRMPDPVLQAATRQHLREQIRAESGVAGGAAQSARRNGVGWRRVTVTSLVLVVTVAASVLAIAAGQRLVHHPLPARSASPAPSPLETRSIIDGAVTRARATLHGAITGTVHLTGTSDGHLEIQMDTADFPGSKQRTVELATTLGDVTCAENDDSTTPRVIDWGQVDVSGSTTLQEPSVDGNDYGDFSYMHVLVLAPNGGSTDDYCTASKMGIAELQWTRPAAFLALRATDHGETPAATGTVHTTDGRPASYDVAPDDQLRWVAARFGLTPDELLYLNPRRLNGPNPTLFIDEVLNLDTHSR